MFLEFGTLAQNFLPRVFLGIPSESFLLALLGSSLLLAGSFVHTRRVRGGEPEPRGAHPGELKESRASVRQGQEVNSLASVRQPRVHAGPRDRDGGFSLEHWSPSDTNHVDLEFQGFMAARTNGKGHEERDGTC